MQPFYFNLRNHDGAPQADEKCIGGGQGINCRPGNWISTLAQHSYAVVCVASDPTEAEMQFLPGGHYTPITVFTVLFFLIFYYSLVCTGCTILKYTYLLCNAFHFSTLHPFTKQVSLRFLPNPLLDVDLGNKHLHIVL